MEEPFYARVKDLVLPAEASWTIRGLSALHILTEASFVLFIVLSLITPSWRYGPFTWWPLWEYDLLAGAPVKLGVFNVLPALVVAGWLGERVLNRKARPAWSWGRRAITLPLLGLTILGLLTLNPAILRRTFIHGGGLILTWLVYLYVINERPRLTLPICLIILTQAGVAIAQFALQRDLGLVAMGELPLNPLFEGITVLYARGQPWLRAYGLTAHPNLLGALLATLLLLLLPVYGRWRGWRKAGLIIVMSVGALGLLVSFSRAAWLGLATGMLAWTILSGRLATIFRQSEQQQGEAGNRRPPVRRVLLLLLLLLPLLIFLWLNYDLVLSRFVALSTPVEAESISQRLDDARTALRVIADYPLFGVGLGNYVYAALHFDPDANRVHNVPLFVAAELGIVGGLLWLWLAVAPFWPGREKERQGSKGAGEQGSRGAEEQGRLVTEARSPVYLNNRRLSTPSPAQLAPWVAMIAMSMFDTMLWWSSNWQTAILFALLAAHLTREVTNATDQRPATVD
ncbi:MAG TPA: O-antigen ligase family protein [Anaerolineae bacterium]